MELSNQLYNEVLDVLKKSIIFANNEDERRKLVDLLVNYIRDPLSMFIGNHKVSGDQYHIIMGHINNKEKIKAIKEMRMATGLGLKEAKEVIDDYLPPEHF